MHLIFSDAFSSLWSLMYYFIENMWEEVSVSAVDFLNLNVIPVNVHIIARLVRMRVFFHNFLLNMGRGELCKLSILFRDMHIHNANIDLLFLPCPQQEGEFVTMNSTVL